MRPSRIIITDYMYILTQFHIYIYIYFVTEGFSEFLPDSQSVIKSMTVSDICLQQ